MGGVSARRGAWALETPMSSFRRCDNGLMVRLRVSCSADADDLFLLPRLMHLSSLPRLQVIQAPSDAGTIGMLHRILPCMGQGQGGACLMIWVS